MNNSMKDAVLPEVSVVPITVLTIAYTILYAR